MALHTHETAKDMTQISSENDRRTRLVSPATIMGSIQFDMSSMTNGRTYRIFVYEPVQEPPPGGYPVIYVTDGNAFFPIAAMQADMMEENALIVGIGYPAAGRRDPDILRCRDLTWEAPPADIGADFAAYLQSQQISYGGAEEYFRFLRQEVEPAVSAIHTIDREKRTIFGDSLGGLFALSLLFKYPGEFKTYVAGSPSIWWNDKAILHDLPSFRHAIESRQASPRVLITVGSQEQSMEGLRVPKSMDRERFEQMIHKARMVENARELASELQGIGGSKEYCVEYHSFAGETHQSVVGATMSRAIRFSAT